MEFYSLYESAHAPSDPSQLRDHIVIAGFGQAGQQLALDALREHLVVALDWQVTQAQQSFAEGYSGLALAEGDLRDRSTLSQIGAPHARIVVFAADDTLTNITGVRALNAHFQQHDVHRRDRLEVYVQVHDPDWIEELRTQGPLQPGAVNPQIQVRLFNVHQLAARRLLQRNPVYQWADWRGQSQPHVVLFGFGAINQQIILTLAQLAHYKDLYPPQITVLAPDIGSRGQAFVDRHPGLANPKTAYITFHDFDARRQSFGAHRAADLQAWFGPLEGFEGLEGPPLRDRTRDLLAVLDSEYEPENAYGDSVTAMVVGFDNDADNVHIARKLRQETKRSRRCWAPLLVWVSNEGLDLFERPSHRTPDFGEIIDCFGQVEEICRWNEVIEGSSDKLAEALHEAYLETDGGSPTTGTDVPWAELAEPFKQSNRTAADHLQVKLLSADYVVPGPVWAWSEAVDLTAHPALPALEHRRWCAERYLAGWRYHSKRSNTYRLHPDLVAFEKLPPGSQAKPWDQIAKLQRYFGNDPANAPDVAIARRVDQLLYRTLTEADQKVRPDAWLGVLAGDDEASLVGLAQHGWAATGLQGLLEQRLEQRPAHHWTVVCPLGNPLEQQLALALLQALEQAGRPARLLVPRAYPFDLPLGEAGDETRLEPEPALARRIKHLIDLLPPGTDPVELLDPAETGPVPHTLRQRAVAYVTERTETLILVPQGPGVAEASGWWADPRQIPQGLSSLPAHRRPSAWKGGREAPWTPTWTPTVGV